MASIHLTHAPILGSSVQLLVLPVNTAGTLLDPVLARTKSLYPDNYRHYRKACIDGSLKRGTCLIHKCAREHSGLGVGSHNKPSYIANLVISDHPYHRARTIWLTQALNDLSDQLMALIRYQGVRKAALLARPLLFDNASINASLNDAKEHMTTRLPLDWQDITLPLITQHLQELPKLRIDIHIPKSVKL
ncbi:hypothetical protein ACTXGO_12455, partial [Psychrobacter sp. T6-1]|uniref:hypothetical protein n=1 Tax=Psychrobacter sp. T6-1 TaxID=3457447 RepID=UPI003FD493C8